MAATLNGRQYREEITKAECNLANEHNLVVVFGASDDLVEFRGIIHDEVGAYGGEHIYFLNGKVFSTDDVFDDVDEKLEYLASMGVEVKHKIQAIWGSDECSWIFITDIPHHTFEIYEDDDLYCRGIVFEFIELLK